MFYVKAFTNLGNQVRFTEYKFDTWEKAIKWMRKLLYAGYKVEITNTEEGGGAQWEQEAEASP